MTETQFDDWCVAGEYGNGFYLGCPECDWEHESPVVAASIEELRAIAQGHVEEAHP